MIVKESKSVTIYNIAEEAGVSASTVSRVINQKKGVKRQTRERVLALLEKYNYSPDVAARSLVSGETRIIGILVADIRVMHYTEGAYIIEREFAQRGYDSLIFNTGTDDPSKRKCIESLAARKPSAAVMIGSTFQSDEVRRCIEQYLSDIPVVMANGFFEMPNVYGVLTDEMEGVQDCVRFLCGKGRRRIAFVNDATTVSSMLKEKGYLTGIARYCSGQEPIVARFQQTGCIQQSSEVTQALLKEHPGIDAIIYATDLIAAGALAGIRAMGLSVPGDIAVIGIDNSIYAEICYPTLTSLDNQLLALNVSCAGMVLNVLDGKPVPQKAMVYSKIVERGST